jgi:hypothetical protein
VNCLFCGKRLSFFHGKKKPYCSDVHEDRYRERQAKTGLDRLQDQSLLGPPKLPELFSHEKAAPANLAPEPVETFYRSEEGPESCDPPTAEYLAGDPHGFQPAVPFRDPGAATFPEEDWDVAPVLLSSAAVLCLSASQIGPALVTIPKVPQDPELVEPELETPPGPPSQITLLATLETLPLALSETTAIRAFCEPALTIAVPGLALPARQRALAPIADQARTSSFEPGSRESLPSPQPLRFRTLLDLHNPIFQTAKRRIAPASQVALDWNAIPPESVLWQSKPTRRTVAPVLPRLSGEVTRLMGRTDR